MTGCQTRDVPSYQLTPISFSQLPGWDSHSDNQIVPAIHISCRKVIEKGMEPTNLVTPQKAQAFTEFCRVALTMRSGEELKQLIESELQPYSFNAEGTFTGYYEPELEGSYRRHGRYQTPLYRMPPRSINSRLPRRHIVNGALSKRGLELVWVNDPVDAFFLQIQGSGVVRLENGRQIRLGYAGTNKHPYVAIGSILVQRGEIPREEISMQSIRRWLEAHPLQAETLMSMNPSYVFFKINNADGAIGSQGVVLTPRRSLAVDRDYIPMGSLLWLDIPAPDGQYLNHLVVAQDTGGAIKGYVRGDYFWGTGIKAGHMAGLMKSTGHYYLLLPK